MNRFVASLLVCALPWAAGCGTLGERVSGTSLPKGAPSSEEVLNDLAANDAVIHSFQSGGIGELASPELAAPKRFRGIIRFRRPYDLYVQGNQYPLNFPVVFKLISVGPEFVMEFPNSKDQSFYQLEGEQFEDVPFSVSPSDIAREMFLPEEWGTIRRRDLRIVDFNPESKTATAQLVIDGKLRRVLEVGRVNDQDPKWVLRKNTRLTETGEVLAVTTSDDYTVVDGALFPIRVEATFPTEETRMTFKMNGVKLNKELDEKRYFDIRARVRELNLQERRAND